MDKSLSFLRKVPTGSMVHQPLSQWVSAAHKSCVNRQRREADHSHLASVEVKNAVMFTLPHMP